jgi:hypothetical protein
MPAGFIKAFSRRGMQGNKSMWATLYLSADGAKGSGWLSDSWTEFSASGMDALPPHLYWLSKEDDKLYEAQVQIPMAGRTSITIGQEATEIEPGRALFIRSMIRMWEDEYAASEGVNISQ